MAAKTTAPSGPVFEDAAIPVLTRASNAEPNPFMEVIASLPPNSGAKVVRLKCSLDDMPKVVRKVRKQLQTAGHAAGVSARSLSDHDGTDTLTVTFWTVPRIERKAKA